MNDRLKSGFIWAGVSLLIVIVLIVVIKIGSNRATNSGTVLKTPVTVNDHIQGSTNAKVTLVEYGDFECPVCLTYYPMAKQLHADFPNSVAFVFREFPLTSIHHNAQIAAQAAEASAKQGKFWDMHDMLYNTQNNWSTMSDPTSYFVTLANSIGLNVKQFKIDLNSKTIKKHVAQDLASANANGLNATPTFFLNGKEIQNPKTYTDFKTLVEQALRKINTSSVSTYANTSTANTTAQ